MAPGLRASKSSAAVPVASQVLVGSVLSNSADGSGESGGGGDATLGSNSKKPGVNGSNGSGAGAAARLQGGGYRPRARPQDAELEEDSGSEDEGIQVSKSVAHEKLRVLAERRGIRPNRRASDDSGHDPQQGPPIMTVRTQSSPAPIPQVYPYNLPLTALPTTPRTTRRHMLQTEMSESLRRNLLWERQVSKNTIIGFRRTASTGGAGAAGVRGNGAGGGLLKPLTTMTTAQQQQQVDDEERRRRALALARNRSWGADDYHYTGW
ncbi:hypothetical protein AMATHDRAFT_150195 [Amanita thiersii Skay4041]|uniref:DUF3295 domain-containing protein n=1 Tax=Amanita thiersii Skay4041 TaxID=703135 RepID=A0A2A9NJ80_9AGAR|nr:hypothetical protein AMATHDRAFT_150195 [Amanita thiersii Skay4041]